MCVFDLPEELETKWVGETEIGNCLRGEYGAGARIIKKPKEGDRGFIEVELIPQRAV